MTISARRKSYIDAAQEYLNKNLLGSNKKISQYQLPVEKKKGSETKNIGIVNMENYRMRQIIDNLDNLIDMYIVDVERKQKWKEAFNHYCELMVILRKKELIILFRNLPTLSTTVTVSSSCGLTFMDGQV